VAESVIFDWVSRELERRTSLSRLEARGTIRIVLKDAGLDPNSVAVHQMLVVLERLMASALLKRRIEDADELCGRLAEDLRLYAMSSPQAETETAYDVFERLDSNASRRSKR
jgi:hypothetical protein